eukprot:m.181960 g.181960  ORF g.181960 m.181960 type:complete len:109 (-) comp53477_c0_seq2:68-394(-)
MRIIARCQSPKVLIEGTFSANQTTVHGVLHDGRPIEFSLRPRTSYSQQHIATKPFDERIGTEAGNGWFVKARLQGKSPTPYVLLHVNDMKANYTNWDGVSAVPPAPHH